MIHIVFAIGSFVGAIMSFELAFEAKSVSGVVALIGCAVILTACSVGNAFLALPDKKKGAKHA